MTTQSDAVLAEFTTALRAYATAGDNTSGVHNPGKAALTAAFSNFLSYVGSLESLSRLSGSESHETKSALDAVTPASGEGTLGLVWGDSTASNNGFYVYTSGAWSQLGDDIIPASALSTLQNIQTASEAARDEAEDWATTAEDVEVSGGEFSAKHYAAKADASATAAASSAASISVYVADASVSGSTITLTTGAALSSFGSKIVLSSFVDAEVSVPIVEVDSVSGGPFDVVNEDGAAVASVNGAFSLHWDNSNSRFILQSGGASGATENPAVTSFSHQIGPDTLASGSSAPAGTYILWARPVPQAGNLTSFSIYSGASATVKLKRFSRAGDVLTFIDETSYTVSSGLNEFSTDIDVNAGDVFAIYSSTANFVQFDSVSSPSKTEYTYDATDLTTTKDLGDSVPAGTIQLQCKVVVDVDFLVTPGSVENDQNLYGKTVSVGPNSPTSGSVPTAGTSATYIRPEPLQNGGFLKEIKVHSTADGLCFIHVFNYSSGTYVLSNTFVLQLVSGQQTYVAGTHFPSQIAVSERSVFGWRALTATLSADGFNPENLYVLNLAEPGDVHPATTLGQHGLQTTQRHQITFVVQERLNSRVFTTPDTYRFNEAFTTQLAPGVFDATNWTISGGVAQNSSTGLASSVVEKLGDYADGTFRVRLKFTGATDEVALFRSPSPDTTPVGSVFTINAGTGLIALRNAYDGTNTLPAVYSSKTCSFSFVTGREYRIDVIKEGTTISLSVWDTVTGESDTLEFDGKVGGHVTSAGFLCGRCGFAAITGTLNVLSASYAPLVADPYVAIFGDSISEGSGATTDADAWSYRVLAAKAGVISAVSGHTSTNIVRRVREHLVGYDIRDVIVLVGTNDTNTTTWQTNIGHIVNSILDNGSRPWICTVPPETADSNPESVMNPWLRSNYPDYLIEIDRALTTGGTGLSADRDATLYADTLHPNDAGSTAIYNRILLDAPEIFDD